MRRLFAMLIVLSSVPAGVLLAQRPPGNPGDATSEPAATFKSEVGIIEIDAIVVDKSGNFIRDLTRDDFQVYEDGRARPFSLFSLVDKPVTVTSQNNVPESDVRTLADTQSGRVYVIVLDDLHTAPLRTAILKAA